jgi:hypothetical protein
MCLKYILLLKLIFIVCHSTEATCPDKILYCFDSKGLKIGEIVAEQCFKWNRLSCEACHAYTNAIKINFSSYLNDCRKFSPRSMFVLSEKSVWAHKASQILKIRFKGK